MISDPAAEPNGSISLHGRAPVQCFVSMTKLDRTEPYPAEQNNCLKTWGFSHLADVIQEVMQLN